MNLELVALEIETRLNTIAGFNGYGYPIPNPPSIPCGILVPQHIDYDKAYSRGGDVVKQALIVLSGLSKDRDAYTRMAGLVSSAGAGTVKAAVEASGYVYCDYVQVKSGDWDVAQFGENEYLAVILDLEIVGSGV